MSLPEKTWWEIERTNPVTNPGGDQTDIDADELESRMQQLLSDLTALCSIRSAGVIVMGEMTKRMIAKGHDYSGKDQDTLHNLKASEDLGLPSWIGVLVRMGDKWRRMCTFARQQVLKVKDETFEDTVIDLAVYCVWCVVLYRERKREQETSAIGRPSKEYIEACNKAGELPLVPLAGSDVSGGSYHQPAHIPGEERPLREHPVRTPRDEIS